MLCVKTKLRESKIDGIGLFADQDIKKNDILWKANDCLSYNEYSKEELENLKNKLSSECFSQIKKYIYRIKGESTYNLDLDDARFINHAVNPNTRIIAKDLLAIEDIKKGEEITMNYFKEYENWN